MLVTSTQMTSSRIFIVSRENDWRCIVVFIDYHFIFTVITRSPSQTVVIVKITQRWMSSHTAVRRNCVNKWM